MRFELTVSIFWHGFESVGLRIGEKDITAFARLLICLAWLLLFFAKDYSCFVWKQGLASSLFVFSYHLS